jgi:hypothetical protein
VILSTFASNQPAHPLRDARSVGRNTERRTRKNDTLQDGDSRETNDEGEGQMIWELAIAIILFYIGSIVLEKVVKKNDDK